MTAKFKTFLDTLDPTTRAMMEGMEKNIVFQDYTRGELRETFELVQNKEHWKAHIDAMVPADTCTARVTAAVVFFAGCEPKFTYLPEGIRVQAVGYFAAVGA